MDKRYRTEAINGATRLPEETIQHIQSFLSGKEAARTTILSKSWYKAWLTRPNLDFNGPDFPFPRYNENAFVKFATKTVQRYSELNRKIQSFRLCMSASWFDDVGSNISLVNKMITQAIKLGVTDLHIELTSRWVNFVLPLEVLESETLVRLSLYGGTIDLQKVSCSKLRSLILCRVSIDGDNLWDIISISPSIEKLVLCGCKYDSRMLVLKPTGFSVVYFHKLRVLWLEKVRIGEWFFREISSLPCLKELTIYECIDYKEIQICSSSLEYISITEMWRSVSRFSLDFPKIRKFKYSGYGVPSLSLKTGSTDWASEIFIRESLIDFKQETLSWFDELRNFLLKLNTSKISLSLNVLVKFTSLVVGCDYTEDIIIPSVEKLKLFIDTPSQFKPKILENIFLSCRPKVITLAWNICDDFAWFLCNTLVEKVEGHKNQNMPALRDLVEVNVEFFEDDVTVGRRLLPWKTLLEASTDVEKFLMNRTEIWLQLKWGESSRHSN